MAAHKITGAFISASEKAKILGVPPARARRLIMMAKEALRQIHPPVGAPALFGQVHAAACSGPENLSGPSAPRVKAHASKPKSSKLPAKQ